MTAAPEQDADAPFDWSTTPHQLLNHLIWDVFSRLSARGENALSATPLSFASLGALQAIVAKPGVTTAEIARNVPVTQQATSQVTIRLEKLGFIERRLGPGRGIALHATAAGVEAAAQAGVVERDYERGLYDLLGAQRYAELCRLLAESREILAGDTHS